MNRILTDTFICTRCWIHYIIKHLTMHISPNRLIRSFYYRMHNDAIFGLCLNLCFHDKRGHRVKIRCKGKTISENHKQKGQEILFFLTTIKDNFCFHRVYTLRLPFPHQESIISHSKLCFPYLPIRCALGVPSFCKGTEGEPKGNVRYT